MMTLSKTHSQFTFKILILTSSMLALTACGGGSSGSGGSEVVTPTPAPTNQAGSVDISGTLQIGQVLTASVSDGNGTNGSTISYQWSRNGTEIAGATSSSLTTVQADVGTSLTVNAVYTDEDGFSENVTSAGTADIEEAPATDSSGSVSITGTAQVGQTLSAAITDANGVTASNTAFEWRRDGTAIAGATSDSYTLVSADEGSQISVNVIYTDDDGFGGDVTSSSTAAVMAAPATDSSGSVSITGTAQVGQTLSAVITDSNGVTASNTAFEWRRDGTAIAGATSNSYTLVPADEGGQISVNIIYTDDDGFVGDVTSSPTVAVTAAPVSSFAGNFPRGVLGDKDSVPAINCDMIYTDAETLAEDATRTIAAGTTLCLADGTYGDFELDFGGVGTEVSPITIAAENSGGAIIEGETSVRMSGSFVVLQGLVFKGGESASSDFLQTRDGSGGVHCNNCRITEISVIDLQSDSSGKWLNIYGADNRIDHSWLAGKTNRSVMLSINREIPSGGTTADIPVSGTVIDHNYFGDRPPTDGKAYAENSDNDYEAIRIGTSPGHAFDSNVLVEYNYFERIDGEAEVISNKAGNNIIANNTIRDSYGSLTTRHGANATIEGNFIIGDGHPFAGGIRIVDDGHRIVNNYIEGARYKDTRFHGGVVIHNGDGSTTNGYQNLFNVLVAHNTIVDSVNSLNVNGGNQSTNPRDVFFVNNIIDDAIGPIITQADEGLPANSSFAGNYVFGQSFSDDSDIASAGGFIDGDITMAEDALGISRPTDITAVAADGAANIGSFAAISDDMDGDTRPATTQSGSDHATNSVPVKGLLTFDDVGPMGYRPDFSVGYVGRVPIANAGFDSTDGWDFTAPATLTNDAAERFSGSTAVMSAAGSLSQNVVLDPNTTYTLSAFTKGPIQLSVTNDGNTARQHESNSDYTHSTLSFNTGSSGETTISAALDDAVEVNVAIADPSFDDFTGDSSDPNWIVSEQNGVTGQVQATGNSATGDSGALKFRLNADSGEVGGQGVTQELSDILPNTEYTLSAFVLYKRDRDDVTATIGVFEAGTTNVLASKVLDYQALEAAGAPESEEDDFLFDSFTFNSGSQTELTLFVTYDVNDVLATTVDQSVAQADSELWVDDISLSSPGAPEAGIFGFIDDVRLVSHGN